MILPVSLVTWIAAPEIVAVLLGPGWSEAIVPLQVLSLGMFFRVAYKIGGAVTRGVGAVYRMVWRQALYAIIVLGGGLIGQSWGLRGVALAVLLAVITNYLLMSGLSLRLLNLHWRELGSRLSKGALLTLIGGLPAWCVAEAVRPTHLPAILGLLLIGVSWAIVVVTVLRLKPTWFLDFYTYRIIEDLAARIRLGPTLLSVIMPPRTPVMLREKERAEALAFQR
jgi:PST family polysaccharide transporter